MAVILRCFETKCTENMCAKKVINLVTSDNYLVTRKCCIMVRVSNWYSFNDRETLTFLPTCVLKKIIFGPRMTSSLSVKTNHFACILCHLHMKQFPHTYSSRRERLLAYESRTRFPTVRETEFKPVNCNHIMKSTFCKEIGSLRGESNGEPSCGSMRCEPNLTVK